MKTMFNISKAIEIIGGIQVPSVMANSIEVAEALRMALKALEMQINLGQTLQEFTDSFNATNSYSESLVMELLNDSYMFAEVNEEIEENE